MRIILEQITQGIDEIIIRYREKTPELTRILACIEQQEQTMTGNRDGKQFPLSPRQIIYLESVEGITYMYTETEVYQNSESLFALESQYKSQGFFRCSKAMVINIYRIQSLKSEAGNRIDAQMDNGEHVIISRRYAKELRAILKGEKYE